eukprot:gene11595-11386_t
MAIGTGKLHVGYGTGYAAIAIVERVYGYKPEVCYRSFEHRARTVVAPVVAASYANGNVLMAGKSVTTTYLPSVKAGIHIEQRVSPNFYINPGAFYSVYGFKMAATAGTPAADYSYTTAEVPLY